jgi:type II secretory pathway pseudopilin PulG
MVRSSARRPGVTLVEVLVILGILAFALLVLAMVLPRGREDARALRCQAQLRDIGAAVALYDGATGHLPTVPAPGAEGAGPLGAMLGQLGVARFAQLSDPAFRPGTPGPPPPAVAIRDFLCPSDPWTVDAGHPAPVSYRACAGDRTDGTDGAFAPGRTIRLADVASADGTEYTAAFAERLVGDGRPEPDRINYALVPGPVGPEGCGDPGAGSWRGDAGSDWSAPGWVSTLYNHAIAPGGSPSCVAEDGGSARMGASSGHPDAVHVLLLDGAVRRVRPGVEPRVWAMMATTREPEPDPNASQGQAP